VVGFGQVRVASALGTVVEWNTPFDATASCNPGELAINGGYELQNFNPNPGAMDDKVIASHLVVDSTGAATGWTVRFVASGQLVPTFVVYADCVSAS
jgi:hypothetical protein